MNKRMKNTGVTLIELLVAVVITVIVGASIVGALYSGRSAWQSGSDIAAEHQNLRATVDLISRDLESAIVFPDGDDCLAGFWSDGNALVFTALTGNAKEGFELFWTAYRLNGTEIEKASARYHAAGYADAVVDAIDPATAEDPIADISWDFEGLAWDISGLEFRFFENGVDYGAAAPDTSWNFGFVDPRLPELVEIRITPAVSGKQAAACVHLPVSGILPYVP
jgi:type II secretory pathway pseudopilin PulG